MAGTHYPHGPTATPAAVYITPPGVEASRYAAGTPQQGCRAPDLGTGPATAGRRRKLDLTRLHSSDFEECVRCMRIYTQPTAGPSFWLSAQNLQFSQNNVESFKWLNVYGCFVQIRLAFANCSQNSGAGVQFSRPIGTRNLTPFDSFPGRVEITLIS